MELLVIRHAIAVDRFEGTGEVEDAARPLTDRGRRRFKQAVRGLEKLGARVDRVIHSPWTRAAETAELLAPIVDGDLDDARVETASLAGPPRAELFGELALLGEARVALVGHEPWLGELVALLTCGASSHGESMRFKKGAVAWLEGAPTPAGMDLLAFLPPRVLRSISGSGD
jgi:phosphohistidine phosphatase